MSDLIKKKQEELDKEKEEFHKGYVSEMLTASHIAEEIMQMSRDSLMVKMRFMDVALFKLEQEQAETTLATNGKQLYYGVYHVLNRYMNDNKQVARDIMHVTLHCIFRHFFVAKDIIDRARWDLSTDVAVENLLYELGLQDEDDERILLQRAYIEDLKENIPELTAEKIYNYFKEQTITLRQAVRAREIFQIDNHTIWYDDDYGEEEQEWEDISTLLEVDMETMNEVGTKTAEFIQELKALNRERYDYTDFLKKFSVMGEVMKTNDDEFDYIYYTYGLNTYGNMPLVEPLEYKEEKRIKEFVIAIDTSGSVKGDLVQRFMSKTYNVLKSADNFFSHVNIHIIQCDAEIKEAVKITSDREFDEYLRDMELKGFGGTDFTPVFQYINEQIELGEFTNLQGLIYFTDGYGTFPQAMPKYKTACVFMRDSYDNPEVPPWVIKLILESDEI